MRGRLERAAITKAGAPVYVDDAHTPDAIEAALDALRPHAAGRLILVFGAGMTMTNYYGVEVSRDGRWLQVSASEGTEPRNDLWVADLQASPAHAPLHPTHQRQG